MKDWKDIIFRSLFVAAFYYVVADLVNMLYPNTFININGYTLGMFCGTFIYHGFLKKD